MLASLTALGALLGSLQDSVVLAPSEDAAGAVEGHFPEGKSSSAASCGSRC